MIQTRARPAAYYFALWGVLGLCAIIGVILLTSGCDNIQELQSASETATEEATVALAEYERLEAEYRALVAAGGAGSDDAARVLKAMEDAKATVEAVVAEIQSIDGRIQKAETGWDLLYAALAIAGGFIPGVGVALPFVGVARRRFTGVVEAVARGGGPADPLATSRAMDPRVKRAVAAVRRKIGDTIDRSATP